MVFDRLALAVLLRGNVINELINGSFQSLHSGYSSLVRAGIQLAAIGDIIPIVNLIADSGSASRYPAAIWPENSAFVVPTDSTIISFAVHIIVVYAAIVDIIARPFLFCRLRILVRRDVVVTHRTGDVEHEDDVQRIIRGLGAHRIRRERLKLEACLSCFRIRYNGLVDMDRSVCGDRAYCSLRALCAVLTVVLSAAIAVTGRTLRSISTASTMLKKRFFMFFFPPVSNFLMCFDAFLSAKVSCVSLYQNFSKKQVPKHPSKRPEILVLSSFPLKNSRF